MNTPLLGLSTVKYVRWTSGSPRIHAASTALRMDRSTQEDVVPNCRASAGYSSLVRAWASAGSSITIRMARRR
jgi:hypothetical protein